MSCWRRTTVLRIPAIRLGFVYWGEWNAFCDAHDDDFNWEEGWFSPALCDSYPYTEYRKWLPREGRPREKGDRLDMGLYPEKVKSVPGPFLDYTLEEILPADPKHEKAVARPLTKDEKEKYLPEFRKLFPDFPAERMNYVHYCRYEWYDGSEAMYLY